MLTSTKVRTKCCYFMTSLRKQNISVDPFGFKRVDVQPICDTRLLADCCQEKERALQYVWLQHQQFLLLGPHDTTEARPMNTRAKTYFQWGKLTTEVRVQIETVHSTIFCLQAKWSPDH
jgi:hypothetical protein